MFEYEITKLYEITKMDILKGHTECIESEELREKGAECFMIMLCPFPFQPKWVPKKTQMLSRHEHVIFILA